MSRRLKPHHHLRPALTITTGASAETALDALVEALVVARASVVRRDAGSATLQLGSFLRAWVFSDSMLLDVVPRTRVWGMRATIDLEVLAPATEQGTRVRVALTKVDEHRETVPHVLGAIEGAAEVLRRHGHTTEVGEVGPGQRKR